MAIGLADLVLTVVLYMLGLIRELNPLMAPLLESSVPLFSFVKLATLAAAYLGLQAYRVHDPVFVSKATVAACYCYLALWSSWVLVAHLFF